MCLRLQKELLEKLKNNNIDDAKKLIKAAEEASVLDKV